jgi:predicted outer membrane protein
MIANATEYQRALDELRALEQRLRTLQDLNSLGVKGFTKAGVRKMIARLHEELALFEGSAAAKET